MDNKLKTYIKEQRNELDSFEPSQSVWNKIDAGLQNTSLVKSKISWLKYFAFGASVICLLVYFKMKDNSEDSHAQKTQHVAEVSSEQTKQPDLVQNVYPEQGEEKNQMPGKKAFVNSSFIDNPNKSFAQDDSSALAITPIPNEIKPFTENENKPDVTSSVLKEKRKLETNSMNIDTAFTGIKRLEINCGSADIKITSHSRQEVSFNGNIKYEAHGLVVGKPNYKILYERNDSVLKVSLVNTSKNNRVIIGTVNQAAFLNFEVPKETDLVINNSYGNVSVVDMQGKTFLITTTSGDVTVENINTDMKLELGYGNLSAKNIKGNIQARLTSGDISVINQSGNSAVETSYGNQKYHQITGNIKTRSTSGDIKIIGMTGNADINSSYGNIDLDGFKGYPAMSAVSGDITGKNVELTDSMQVKANYGNIKMILINDISSLSFDLQAKYGTITINKNGQKFEEEHKLMLKNGNILIKGLTESGDQSYK